MILAIVKNPDGEARVVDVNGAIEHHINGATNKLEAMQVALRGHKRIGQKETVVLVDKHPVKVPTTQNRFSLLLDYARSELKLA